MSHVKETTLLTYVIAYLQEEVEREQRPSSAYDAREWFDCRVDEALDAYAGGAR